MWCEGQAGITRLECSKGHLTRTESLSHFLKRPYDRAIPLLGIYSEPKFKKYMHSSFTATLFTIARTWKQLISPSAEVWVGDFPSSPVIKTPPSISEDECFLFLMGELRSHMPWSTAKKNQTNKNPRDMDEEVVVHIDSGIFSSVQFSRSVVSDSLQPHESQHARPPCPSPTPGVYSNPCPSSRWCHPTISSSVIPFSSCHKKEETNAICRDMLLRWC